MGTSPDEAPDSDSSVPVEADAANQADGDLADDRRDEVPAGGLNPRRLGIVAVTAIITLVVDQASKAWALRSLQDGPVEVLGDLHFELAYNTGAAFSLGGGRGLGPWITVLAMAVVVTVAMGRTSRIPLGAVAAGLISGGSVGNLADRAFRGDDGFLHGAVVDFIALDWWPTFNIADSAIVVGAVLLVLASLRVPEP